MSESLLDEVQYEVTVPRVLDRVVMVATGVVLEAIFDVDLPPEQHGYRATLGAHTAIKAINGLLNTGHRQVIEADLADYFGSIPHAELLKSVARRVSDRHILHLIKMWLDAPVEEDAGKGGTRRTTQAKDTGRGVPQGAPISPLLSNLYMRRFVLGWKKSGLERRLRARIVAYADDFVICCAGGAEEAMVGMRRLMERLKLTINESKTHIRRLPEERFDFLGYSFGRYYSPKTGRAYLCAWPSRRSISRIVGAIREATRHGTTWQDDGAKVEELNRTLRGWANYFSLGPVDKAYKAVNSYSPRRLRRWLCEKHKVGSTGVTRYPTSYLFDTIGLYKLRSQRA